MVTRPTFPSDSLSHGNQQSGKSAKSLKRHSAQKRGWRYNTRGGRSLSANIARLEERLLFAKNFLQHPGMLGSLIPSSRFLVERLLRKIDWSQAQTVVEYGPGVGTITGSMLARMHPQARLVVFE